MKSILRMFIVEDFSSWWIAPGRAGKLAGKDTRIRANVSTPTGALYLLACCWNIVLKTWRNTYFK